MTWWKFWESDSERLEQTTALLSKKEADYKNLEAENKRLHGTITAKSGVDEGSMRKLLSQNHKAMNNMSAEIEILKKRKEKLQAKMSVGGKLATN
jgi:hypothetical protein